MKQQVNLYHSRFGAKPRLLSARQIVWIGGLCAAFLGLLFGVEQLRTRDEAHALEALREGSADAADGIVRLAETHPPARANPGLQEEVERRTSEREVKSELLRLLSSHSLGNAGGVFSLPGRAGPAPRKRALADRDPPHARRSRAPACGERARTGPRASADRGPARRGGLRGDQVSPVLHGAGA